MNESEQGRQTKLGRQSDLGWWQLGEHPGKNHGVVELKHMRVGSDTSKKAETQHEIRLN